MASHESVRRRQIAADARVAAAVAALVDRSGVEPVVAPRLPGGVDAAYRGMALAEALAGTLERIVAQPGGDVPDEGAGASPDAQRLSVVLGLLAEALDVPVNTAAAQVDGVLDRITADEEAERLAREADAEADAEGEGEGDLTGEPAAGEPASDAPPKDLDTLSRLDLNALATSLGIADAGKLSNKAAVIAAIKAARAAGDGHGAGEGDRP